MCAQPNLDDARACLARARRHCGELNQLTHLGALWRISEAQDGETGEWHNCLHLDRARLVAIKPILADSATNAISALDQVAAAIARTKTNERLFDLKFPWFVPDRNGKKPTKKDLKKNLKKLTSVLGREMLLLLAAIRRKSSVLLPHVEAARQISNSGKHWELPTTAGIAAGVQHVTLGVGYKTFDLPADAFAASDVHEYYRGQERLPNGHCLIVTNLVVDGLEGGLPNAVSTILECSFRFVQGVIDAVAAAGAGEGNHTA